jgi:integrase
VKLTTTAIKALTLPPGVADRTFWDDDIGGFGLRLRAGGSARWVVQYDMAGKTKRVTLGTTALLDVGAARTKAKDLLAHVRLGGDPAAEKRSHRARAAETFVAILPRYLICKQRDCRQSSFKQIERRLWKLAQPLHPLPITAIDRRSIASLIAAVADSNGPSAATNLHGTLSGCFSWLMGAGLLEQNPMLYANKPKPLPARDRMPTENELRSAWAALGDDDYSDIFKLLTYTACRRGEIGGLRWDEVDLEKAVIELPGARMKNGKPHVVPLSEPALAILKTRQRNGREHVFGRGTSGFQGWSWRRKDLDDKIAGKRPDWVLHDLRRLASTTMHDKLGIQPHIVERVLAHVGHQSGVAGTYNKAAYLGEKRRALERWAAHVTAITTVEPAAAKVVQLRMRRADRRDGAD